jgi:hypothetical protein
MQLDRWGEKQREVKKVMERVGRMQEELERGAGSAGGLRDEMMTTARSRVDIQPNPADEEGGEEEDSGYVKFTVLKGNGLPTLLGETKAYCNIKYMLKGSVLGDEKRTQVKRGTDVMWNEQFSFPTPQDEEDGTPGFFAISLWSKNVFVSDDFIGSFELMREEIKGGKCVVKEVKGKEGATQGLCTIVGGGVLDDLL